MTIPPSENRIHALTLSQIAPLSEETKAYFAVCQEKLGLVPNVLRCYAFNPTKLRAFTDMYSELMLGESGLSKLEREMIAVAVSAVNHCHYCLVAHGSALRALSGNPAWADTIGANYRAAELSPRQRAMLDFAVRMTGKPETVEESHRQDMRDAGLTDHDIWDVAAVAAFFNMTNRMASAIDMRPNPEYNAMAR